MIYLYKNESTNSLHTHSEITNGMYSVVHDELLILCNQINTILQGNKHYTIHEQEDNILHMYEDLSHGNFDILYLLEQQEEFELIEKIKKVVDNQN